MTDKNIVSQLLIINVKHVKLYLNLLVFYVYMFYVSMFYCLSCMRIYIKHLVKTPITYNR